MKGGKFCEVIGGKRKGKFAQIPNNKQKQEFLNVNKVFAEYYHDNMAMNPVKEEGVHVPGITSIANLNIIGFYD